MLIMEKEDKICLSKKLSEKYNLGPEDEFVEIEHKNGFKLIPKRKDLTKIYLELTTRCNFDCITCIRNSWAEGLGHMSDELLDSFFAQLDDLPELETIHLGGFGEPQIHPRFNEVVSKIKKLGYRLEIITNGQLLTPKRVRELVELEVDKIFVSMDAPRAEEFEEIRKNSDYPKLLENLEYLRDYKQKKNKTKPKLAFEFVAMKDNYQLLPNLMGLAEQLDVEKILVTNLLPYTEDMVEQTLYQQPEKKSHQFKTESKGSFLYLKTKFPKMKIETERECDFIADKSLSITWEGNVSPCYPLLHSYKCYVYGREKEIERYHLANIAQESIAQIWTKDEYIKFRDRLEEERFPSCHDCKYIDGCGMTVNNQLDCWGHSPSCADCLWYRGIILCP